MLVNYKQTLDRFLLFLLRRLKEDEVWFVGGVETHLGDCIASGLEKWR